jgi:inner membrane protein
MMALTHATIAAAATSLILTTADPLTLGLAIAGSQLPDLDTSTSLIGQTCFPLSHWLEKRFPHRTITHCIWATLAIALLALPVGWYFGNLTAAAALPIGHLVSCFSDTFTKQGVQLFYPVPAWCISVSNPRRRLTTGGVGEYWVLAMAIAFLCGGMYLAGGGGFTQGLSQAIGTRDAAIEVYNRSAANHQMYVEIKGNWASDRSRADGRYFVLGNDGSHFLVMDRRGIYRTDEQILVERLTVSAGDVATVQVQTVVVNDEAIVPKLQKLIQAYPNAAVYLSGAVTVDMPEDVQVPYDPQQFATVTLTGTTVTMSHHPIEQAISELSEQWGMGNLEAKIISPKPQL